MKTVNRKKYNDIEEDALQNALSFAFSICFFYKCTFYLKSSNSFSYKKHTVIETKITTIDNGNNYNNDI